MTVIVVFRASHFHLSVLLLVFSTLLTFVIAVSMLLQPTKQLIDYLTAVFLRPIILFSSYIL